MDRGATPVRRLDLSERDGYQVLGETWATWADGAEEEVAAILAAAGDLSSISDELALHTTTWPLRYHLARERAHLLRPLAIDGNDAVLEIGAGCGAVTRYLGEQARLVDALEPTPLRARAAALRTRDLGNVAVLVGELEMLPREPAYDLIAAVGVLEYVGGAKGIADRIEFLRGAAARLKPGGTIVVAIENRLGVKYLAGAPEDHANLPFEGLEDYPHAGPYRTFARRELEALFTAAGLRATTLHVFPDYKLPRLIYADSLLAGDTASLAWRVPSFPSYDSPLPRGRLASEYELWRGAVRAGLGGELANSFLVLATVDEAVVQRWPAGQHAAFYTTGRRACFTAETRVVDDGGEVLLRRRRLGPAPAASGSGLTHHVADAPFSTGEPLAEALARADDAELGQLMDGWRRHVEAAAVTQEGRNADPAASNVLCKGDEWLDIDVEWRHTALSTTDVLGRALVHLAPWIADRRPPDRWPPTCETLGDLVEHLAVLAGLEDFDVERVIAAEAPLQAEVVAAAPSAPEWPDAVAAQAALLRDAMTRPVALSALGPREPELRVAAETRLAEQDRRVSELASEKQAVFEQLVESNRERDALREERSALIRAAAEEKAQIAELWQRVDATEAALDAIKESRSYRVATAPRQLKSRLRGRS